MLYPITNVIKRDSICHTFKKRRIPLFGIKHEEHHENVVKISLDFGYTFKKEKTPFLGLKIKKSNKKMPKTLGYTSKKEKNTIFVCHRRKRNFGTILPSFLSTSTKNEEPLFLDNRMQKNDKILEKWKPVG